MAHNWMLKSKKLFVSREGAKTQSFIFIFVSTLRLGVLA